MNTPFLESQRWRGGVGEGSRPGVTTCAGEEGAGGSQQKDIRELTDLITDGSTNYSQRPELEGVGLLRQISVNVERSLMAIGWQVPANWWTRDHNLCIAISWITVARALRVDYRKVDTRGPVKVIVIIVRSLLRDRVGAAQKLVGVEGRSRRHLARNILDTATQVVPRAVELMPG